MIQTLLSLPSNAVDSYAEREGKDLPDWVPACDPPDCKLGSGGGTSHLLVEAWKKVGGGQSFSQWLASSKKLAIHAGGQSRRLPAYATTGKLGLPMPVFHWTRGQHLDQTLLDVQWPFYQQILSLTSPAMRMMVASGDVLLRGALNKLAPLPDVDVLCLGMWVAPDRAQNHGVFFCPKDGSTSLTFMRQKPTPREIRDLAEDHVFLVDTGLWIFSERALRVLMAKSDWDWEGSCFTQGRAGTYDLYGEFGLSLGTEPTVQDPDIASLSSAVIPLPEGGFYHFGTTRELIDSNAALQDLVLDQHKARVTSLKPHPKMFVLNASFSSDFLAPKNHTLWIENACVTQDWRLEAEHVITGVPDNDWTLHLPQGMCIDMVPVNDKDWCVRVYGMSDIFRGKIGDPQTHWCNAPVQDWFEQRGLDLQTAGDLEGDIQFAPLFPVLRPEQLTEDMIQWLIASSQSHDPEACARIFSSAEKLSAEALLNQANLLRLFQQRLKRLQDVLPVLLKNAHRSIFYTLDLADIAEKYAQTNAIVPAPSADHPMDLMQQVHHEMFSAAVLRQRGDEGWSMHEDKAFALLREEVLGTVRGEPVQPVNNVLEDQIVWGRSPIRLDLAGGWTDTPPHCLIYGGHVINVAVELNGQPPIQAFARRCEERHIVMRSIDLGVEQCVHSYDELLAYDCVGSGFSIAKAAFCLAGFSPVFNGDAFASLEEQLEAFGGGIEISLLAAIPKGSGLGTSSVLSATLLGTLSQLCGLNWDQAAISHRVLVLEQMLTTGGGWQDQVGGLTRGLKFIETEPGLLQTPMIRWLPDHLFTHPDTSACMLLYYTGITRVAKNILQEIVRGMFLNNQQHERTLHAIDEHARTSYDSLVRGKWESLGHCVQRSWELNQQLDSGTNPPSVQAILDQIKDYTLGAKLLGAGGGGYLYILAKDTVAAARIRETLNHHPPNPRARFVDLGISSKGLEVTCS